MLSASASQTSLLAPADLIHVIRLCVTQKQNQIDAHPYKEGLNLLSFHLFFTAVEARLAV